MLLVCRVLDAGGISSFEAACMVNLQPESAEEAKALIPSLDVSCCATLLGSAHPQLLCAGVGLLTRLTENSSLKSLYAPKLCWVLGLHQRFMGQGMIDEMAPYKQA